jgi:hypothetical protein
MRLEESKLATVLFRFGILNERIGITADYFGAVNPPPSNAPFKADSDKSYSGTP